MIGARRLIKVLKIGTLEEETSLKGIQKCSSNVPMNEKFETWCEEWNN